MRIPRKPFPSYKWRWAVLTPTESLNNPEVFFGVLRVLRKHEGKNPKDSALEEDLARVQAETGTTVNLTRSGERNLIRNSGQYWKNLDLLAESRGRISLTDFGRKVADGDYSEVEFASSIIPNYHLPNPRIHSIQESIEWRNAGLELFPFKLILEILLALRHSARSEAYITSTELLRIVIPLAGDRGTIQEYVDSLLAYRSNPLTFKTWPDCGKSSNDGRMALEYLLFLRNYGFLTGQKGVENTRHLVRYYLADLEDSVIRNLIGISRATTAESMKLVQEIGIPYVVERQRVARMVLNRPNQGRFKQNIHQAYQNQCVVSRVGFPSVLQAAHILPVENNGNDLIENGLLLRADLHILYDSGHLRIHPEGIIKLTESVRCEPQYPYHDMRIDIPEFVNRGHLEWRFNYK
jgi:hypothetical protein